MIMNTKNMIIPKENSKKIGFGIGKNDPIPKSVEGVIKQYILYEKNSKCWKHILL